MSFWFALDMHHSSAIGAKFTFAGKYYAALTNLAYLTRDLHFTVLWLKKFVFDGAMQLASAHIPYSNADQNRD